MRGDWLSTEKLSDAPHEPDEITLRMRRIVDDMAMRGLRQSDAAVRPSFTLRRLIATREARVCEGHEASSTNGFCLTTEVWEAVTMPFATNEGIRIYYEVEGSGPPLVLHHGSFASGADWRDLGYVDVLKHENQLILMDARGHGSSDKPHDPGAYDLMSRASDVTAILDDLNFERANFFGYSLGGWIGFGLARYAPGRVHSLILGGAHPYAERSGVSGRIVGWHAKFCRAAKASIWSLYDTSHAGST